MKVRYIYNFDQRGPYLLKFHLTKIHFPQMNADRAHQIYADLIQRVTKSINLPSSAVYSNPRKSAGTLQNGI